MGSQTKVVNSNPLDEIIPKKVRRSEKRNRKPFTEDEIKAILKAFREDLFSTKTSGVRHSQYYPFIYFLFATGVRNAEAIGLRVRNVDIEHNLVHIKEVMARTVKGSNASTRIRKETKTGKHRVLPLEDSLKEVLLPLLIGKAPDDLVFTSPHKTVIDDVMFQKRIYRKVLSGLGIEHRVLYACRHTFASRCIQQGMTPVITAFLMGNNAETTLRNYVHQLTIPTRLPTI